MACASASGSGSRGRDDDGDDGNPFPPKKLCATSLKLQFEADHYPVGFLEKYRPGLEYKFIEENKDGIWEFRCKIVYRNQRKKEKSITGEICPSKREAQNSVAHAYMQRFGGWRKIVPPEMIIDENNEASAPLKAESVESQLSKFSRGFFKAANHHEVGQYITRNSLVSPVSVAIVLGIFQSGTELETALQIKKTLRLATLPDEEFIPALNNFITSIRNESEPLLQCTNHLNLADGIKVEFSSMLKERFSVDVGNISAEMKNLFPEGSLCDAYDLVLMNTLVFKGSWLKKCDPKMTKKKPFYLGSKDNRVNVDTMCFNGVFRHGEIHSLDAHFLELPYKGRKWSLMLILPNQVDGLSKVEARLSGIVLDDIDDRGASRDEMVVEIPKINILINSNVKDALTELGISKLFDDCDLSGILQSGGGTVNVIHQTTFEMDEEGTRASASTAISDISQTLQCAGANGESRDSAAVGDAVSQSLVERDSIETGEDETSSEAGAISSFVVATITAKRSSFKVDHPAVVLLKDDVTDCVMFIGRLANPTKK